MTLNGKKGQAISNRWIALVLVCVVVMTSNVCAQNTCTSRVLQNIADQVPEITKESVKEKGEIIVSRINANRPIVVEYDQKGVINHIGFKLFGRDLMEKHTTALYKFLERYMLELFLLEKNEDIYTRLKMDHVKITSEIYPEAPLKAGLQKIISDDTSHSSVYITGNGQNYTVSCIKGEKLMIQIVFPVRHELISGYTKVEAERSFYPQLLDFIASGEDIDLSVSDFDVSPYEDGLFCAFQDSYWLDEVVATSYYKKVEEGYEPLFDVQYMKESVYNLFNASHDLDVMIEVEQSLYGNGNKLDFEVPVSELTRYLRSQNCQLYTGIKKIKGNEVQATFIAVNTEFGYQHLFSCTIDKHVLSKHNEGYKVKAMMYCYTPIHNVSSLFEK